MRRLLAALTLCVLSLLYPVYSVTFPVRAQQGTPAQQDQQTKTVYVTRTGRKYHRDGCRYLAASKIAISLKNAEAKGYIACKVCHPPE
jgi:hypothetical protein